MIRQFRSKSRGFRSVAVVFGIAYCLASTTSVMAADVVSETTLIVPGMRVGGYKFGMSRDEVLERIGKPKGDSPREQERSAFKVDGLHLGIVEDSLKGITVLSSKYKFANGLGVGSSEQKIKEAFGNDFNLREFKLKNILAYKKEGLVFVIWNDNKTVIEINVVPQEIPREQPKTNTIVPGVGVGDYKLGMSRAQLVNIIKNKGGSTQLQGNSIDFDGLLIGIKDDLVKGITVFNPRYKFANGLGRGSSEQKVIETFGNNYDLREFSFKNILTYKKEGLSFEVRNDNKTVIEINVSQKVSREPRASFAKPIESVKPYDDVRGKDLSKLNLSARKGLIATLSFNQKTVWPERAKMPPGSSPQEILTAAMNPGLGVRQLHRQGITGKGVNVAIIDQPLYMDNPEYAGRIVAYLDTGCEHHKTSMHGPMVTSLLVGTNCGTAPDAQVYYAAVPMWKADSAYFAKALDWIISQNKKLSSSEKIRVVSVSASPNQSSWANRQMWDRACARAEADGIMVLDCTDSRRRGFIGRGWYDSRDPENVTKCNPWAPPNRAFHGKPTDMGIFVPASPRTNAEDYDKDEFGYRYCGRGGTSRSIPYCAGVLAMGWQVNPELSPEQMRELLFKSAFMKRDGAKIIYPRKFIDLVRKTKTTPKAVRTKQPNEFEDRWPAEKLLARGQELKLLKELADAATAWVSKGDQSSKVEVDRLIDLLLAQPNPSVRAYFASAKIANLCGQPDKAISILEDVVAKHGGEDAPTSIVAPINLVAYHWIGRIARHSGNTARAISAYETILQNSKNLEGINQIGHVVSCKLYLAEIALDNLKDKDLAVRRLDEIVQAIESIDKDKKGEEWDLFQDWVKYQRSVIKDGKIRARQQLAGGDRKELGTAFMTAASQLSLTGVAASSLGLRTTNRQDREILSAASIRRVAENGRSRIDTSLARLVAGEICVKMEKSAEAEKHYSALFQEDSYFSPMGGIGLARCKKARGKADEANEVLEQVEARYPGYGPAVQKLKKSWEENK